MKRIEKKAGLGSKKNRRGLREERKKRRSYYGKEERKKGVGKKKGIAKECQGKKRSTRRKGERAEFKREKGGQGGHLLQVT